MAKPAPSAATMSPPPRFARHASPAPCAVIGGSKMPSTGCSTPLTMRIVPATAATMAGKPRNPAAPGAQRPARRSTRHLNSTKTKALRLVRRLRTIRPRSNAIALRIVPTGLDWGRSAPAKKSGVKGHERYAIDNTVRSRQHRGAALHEPVAGEYRNDPTADRRDEGDDRREGETPSQPCLDAVTPQAPGTSTGQRPRGRRPGSAS